MNNNVIIELAQNLGQSLRSLRIRRNLDQESLANRAGIALNAVKNLENGKGSTLYSLISVLRVMDRIDWLPSLAPAVTISPLQALKSKSPRKRVSRPGKKS